MRTIFLPRQHAARLLPTIQMLLAQAELTLSDCDMIAVGIGPGSFIGVRTAVAVAKSLAYAVNIPVVPVSSLALLAQTAYADYAVKQVVCRLGCTFICVICWALSIRCRGYDAGGGIRSIGVLHGHQYTYFQAGQRRRGVWGMPGR